MLKEVSIHSSRHFPRYHDRLPANLTPVGFEPTPLRNGALSHRLRPLGQSVLGATFWRQDNSYQAVLAICHTVLDISGLAAGPRFLPTALRPGSGPHSGRAVSETGSVSSSRFGLVQLCSIIGSGAWKMWGKCHLLKSNKHPHQQAFSAQLSTPSRSSDACGIRAHALTEWRLEPPP